LALHAGDNRTNAVLGVEPTAQRGDFGRLLTEFEEGKSGHKDGAAFGEEDDHGDVRGFYRRSASGLESLIIGTARAP
jgi:hypothetical protein